MQVIKEESGRPIKAWVGRREGFDEYGALKSNMPDIEDAALQQAKNLARLPFIASNGIALMPDVHAGKGATVGSVIATRNVLIPAAVGVDIGCGMNAVRTNLKASDLPDSLTALRSEIERRVPMGFAKHGKKYVPPGTPERGIAPLWSDFNHFVREQIQADNFDKAWYQLGTLGGGNHFIEICLDESQDVWIMLHSGSRGVGNRIGTHFIELAKREMERWHIHLPDSDLAYLPEGSQYYDAYINAVAWAQRYALENRRVMMEAVFEALSEILPKRAICTTNEAVNCHHNYVAKENHFGENLWVTRKGAIRARKGDLGIIPGSMGQRSYIVQGKGNHESYCSCSHGAGRRMSRTAARKQFSVEDLKAQTNGVECRKDEAVIDEIPAAYKDIDQVMANQADLVDVVHTLKAVLCCKGS